MKTRNKMILAALLSLVTAGTGHSEPLTEEDVSALLGAGLSPGEIATEVRTKGYSGSTEVEALTRMRKTGADGTLLLAVRQGKPAGESGKPDDTAVGDTFTNSIGMKMIKVPGDAYYLAATECTQGQWITIMGYNPSNNKGETLPVEWVSWNDCVVFCHKLTERERKAGRLPKGCIYALPSRTQWEKACRAGSTGDFAGPLDSIAWYERNSGGKTHPVATKQANQWGFHDMYGNVQEMCGNEIPEAEVHAMVNVFEAKRKWEVDRKADQALNGYSGVLGSSSSLVDLVKDLEDMNREIKEAVEDAKKKGRVYCGGTWRSSAENCRSSPSDRDWIYYPNHCDDGLGFRPALVPSR